MSIPSAPFPTQVLSVTKLLSPSQAIPLLEFAFEAFPLITHSFEFWSINIPCPVFDSQTLFSIKQLSEFSILIPLRSLFVEMQFEIMQLSEDVVRY